MARPSSRQYGARRWSAPEHGWRRRSVLAPPTPLNRCLRARGARQEPCARPSPVAARSAGSRGGRVGGRVARCRRRSHSCRRTGARDRHLGCGLHSMLTVRVGVRGQHHAGVSRFARQVQPGERRQPMILLDPSARHGSPDFNPPPPAGRGAGQSHGRHRQRRDHGLRDRQRTNILLIVRIHSREHP